MQGIDPRTSHMLSERSTTWATSPLPKIVSVNIKRLTFIHNDYDQIKKERNKVSETGLVNEAAMKPTKEMKYYQLMVAKTGGKIDGRKNCSPRRGIEPRSPAWQAGILTTILPRTWWLIVATFWLRSVFGKLVRNTQCLVTMCYLFNAGFPRWCCPE